MKMPKLLISFSGGESSAFMTKWLLENKSDQYEMKVVFANTGEENEKTLEFIDKCDRLFGFDLTWVECVTNPENRKGVTANVVNFKTASRNGEPFDVMIAKHGIPNQEVPHCTRELKTRTIEAYLKSIGWKNYYRAIGIRIDELDRINPNWKKERIIYPLISKDFCPMTKPSINRFWRGQSFRLELKGYEDNCKVCWKKTLRKLLTIAKHNPERFDNFKIWEGKYENYIPITRRNNENIKLPIRFFRDNLSVDNILEMAKQPFEEYPDERIMYNEFSEPKLWGHDLDIGGGPCNDESCEI